MGMNEDPELLDAAQRMTDVMNLHAVSRSRGWAAFALADGRSDNVPYESRDDAVRHHKWDRDNFLYLEIPAGGVNDPKEMQGVPALRPHPPQDGLPAARSARLQRAGPGLPRSPAPAHARSTGHVRSAN